MKNQNRAKFREAVFKRDNYKCIVKTCSKNAVDAHHLIERRLWKEPSEQGGYIVDNGVSLCSLHHIEAEKNVILPKTLRELAGIKKVVLPFGFDNTKEYNKWGKVI